MFSFLKLTRSYGLNNCVTLNDGTEDFLLNTCKPLQKHTVQGNKMYIKQNINHLQVLEYITSSFRLAWLTAQCFTVVI